MQNVGLSTSEVESHNAPGVCICYHEYLRQTYRRVLAKHVNIELGYALALSVSSTNDTEGENRLIFCLFVLCVLPKLLTHFEDRSEHGKRMKAIQISRKEMEKMIAKQLLATIFRSNVPKAAHHNIANGSDFLVYRRTSG